VKNPNLGKNLRTNKVAFSRTYRVDKVTLILPKSLYSSSIIAHIFSKLIGKVSKIYLIESPMTFGRLSKMRKISTKRFNAPSAFATFYGLSALGHRIMINVRITIKVVLVFFVIFMATKSRRDLLLYIVTQIYITNVLLHNGSLGCRSIKTTWSKPLFGHRPLQLPGNVTRH
jgi:hypothetical protein